jgi:hypothetical protein
MPAAIRAATAGASYPTCPGACTVLQLYMVRIDASGGLPVVATCDWRVVLVVAGLLAQHLAGLLAASRQSS